MNGELERNRDVDDLISELRARVDRRRSEGAYPPNLEEDLAFHFQRIIERRPQKERPELHSPVEQATAAASFGIGRIPLDSEVPGGQALHRAVSRLVERQTAGICRQVQDFAGPVVESLGRLAAAVEELRVEVDDEIVAHLDTLYEHVAAYERVLIGRLNRIEELTRRIERLEMASRFEPWYAAERFEEQFRGTQAELLERYRDLAARLTSSGPVLDFGCGRGEFLMLLESFGVEARGVELDPDLVKAATERNLRVEQGDGIEVVRQLDDGSLGALVLIQVIEHLSTQQTLDLVSLAARKVRAGGQVLVETVNPQSLYVYAHAFYLDPTHSQPVHPSYLSFLFQEAGFSEVAIEWRSPPPGDDVLEELPLSDDSSATANANIRRLNQLLFAPQDYLIVARR